MLNFREINLVSSLFWQKVFLFQVSMNFCSCRFDLLWLDIFRLRTSVSIFFQEVPILFVQKGEKKPSSQQITTVGMEVVICKKLQQYMHSVEIGFMGMPSLEWCFMPLKTYQIRKRWGGGVQCPSIWGKSLGSRSSIRKCQVNDDMYHVPSLKPNELHLNIGRANAPKGNSSPNHHLFRGLC